MRKNGLISSLTALSIALTAFSTTALAATENYANGEYVATSTMYRDSSGTINTASKSSCDSFFTSEASITLTDDATTIVWYVESATDYGMNPVDNFTVTYENQTYDAVIDFGNDVSKEIAGAMHAANKMTLTLPAEAIDTVLTDGLLVSSYIPAMAGYADGAYATQSYWVLLSDIRTAPVESDMQTSTVTADVEKNTPSYSVTVPANVALGTLSRTEDTTVSFDVVVEAEELDGDSIDVSAVQKGELSSDDGEAIPFTNDFGTQTAVESVTLTGNISVTADDVASVKGGNYTGTTTFTISYFAAE